MRLLGNRRGLNWRRGAMGAGLSAILGLLLARLPSLVYLSYDLPFLFRPEADLGDKVVIIAIDDNAVTDLGHASAVARDRSLHADLLSYLAVDGSNLVAFDLAFQERYDPVSDAKLAKAMAAHGRVVLAGKLDDLPGVVGVAMPPPDDMFRTNALSWGLAVNLEDRDGAIRQHHPGTLDDPTLPWAVAIAADLPVTRGASESERTFKRRKVPRWLNYYGTANTIPRITYADATNHLSGYYDGKIVFIGLSAEVGFSDEKRDTAATPYTRWDGRLSFGVEILATTFLNLWREDWLRRMSGLTELLVLVLGGLCAGYGLSRVRPWTALFLALLGMLLWTALSISLVWTWHTWFSWAVLPAIQIPCALLCSVIAYKQSPLPSPDQKVTPQKSALAAEEESTRQIASVPDHALLRFIQKGGFGEVWLAQNDIGMFRAVKIVYRRSFEDSAPYEREYQGIRKFMPISLSHPGFVNIFHVGRHDDKGYFYYIMEAGDDESAGQQIVPEKYHPRTLAHELEKRGALPAQECLSLMLELTKTLEHLHQQKLIHRDIKPSNIIYVNHSPKLADIGLVTELKTARSPADSTIIGTYGYMPDPEWIGFGTAAVDIYALGRVLYVISFGKKPDDFPELPTDLTQRPQYRGLLQLNNIIWKACENNVDRRYKSVSEMHADLLRLQSGLL